MENRRPAEAFPPGEFLRDEIAARGWTQGEFAELVKRPPRLISEIISGKRGITPETAQALGAALGTSAQYWLNLDSIYQLSKTPPPDATIERQARLREKFPVREMIKRGWIQQSDNFEVLETRVFGFFGIESVDEEPRLPYAAKRQATEAPLSPIQLAWLFRVSQIAHALPIPRFSRQKLVRAIDRLRLLLLSAEEIRHVPEILAECGVRFLIVEPMPASKIDGVCLWLKGRADSPVIALSLRLDRIDNFWFVLLHEIEHVLEKHGLDSQSAPFIIDEHILENGSINSSEEDSANEAAREFCVPKAEMDDFINRFQPFFSEQKLLGFAKRIGVHPGLVAGQLQRRIDRYDLFKKYQVKVREIVTSSALTDGYGRPGPINL